MKKLAYIALAAATLASATPAYAACGVWGWLGFCAPEADW